jgi:A/G-specific adenine glycosylase
VPPRQRPGPRVPAGLTPVLLRWFRVHRRPLPWRADRDPYHIWVAEVLLQQTRVAQAAPYFERFLRAFPTVRALAAASPSEVLKIWQGAGYYARARHLHAAARQVVARRSGEVPGRVEELEELPGVGPYVARAIASLAFDVPVVALEANGLRVAARWTLETGDVRAATTRGRIEVALRDALRTSSSAEFNEALMELGETVCRPRAPRCDVCPVARYCRAYRETDDPSVFPRRAPSPPKPHVRAAVVALREGDRWFVQRRAPSGLLGGLWEFPGGKIETGEQPRDAAVRELAEETGFTANALEYRGVVRHAYSHFSVELHVFEAPRAGRGALRTTPDRRWVTSSQLRRLPLPKATEKVLGLLEKSPDPPRVTPASGRAESPRPVEVGPNNHVPAPRITI